jgi:nucleotide-binding universal stress UspA family protein
VEASRGVTAVVLDAAEEHEAMIIAMGSRGLRGRGRGLLGPVARAVAEHTDRPLIVVPPTPVRAVPHPHTLSRGVGNH